ncbi:sulfatase-like hydrolase/transferase, partial [Escherichia coli]
MALIIFSPVFTYDIPRRKTFLLALLSLPLINGPLVKFTETLYFYYKQVTFSPAYNYPAIAKKFLKTDIWYDESLLLKNKKPNVIVILTEGMSFNVIDSVNNLGLGVTPKLDEIMKKSFFFINYYNHTAATFRGLRGQLTSAYQFKDGVGANGDGFFEITNQKVKSIYNKRLVSLPEILNSNGYKTIFLSSTEKTSTLNAMLKTLSFNEVLGMGDFDFYQNDRMSDKQTFIALKEVVERNKNNKFFIGVYPSGTHHGLDSPDLRFKDGSNSYYNKFYNFDHQVGEFIDYLTSTGLINN